MTQPPLRERPCLRTTRRKFAGKTGRSRRLRWSASLQTGFHRADQFGLGTLIGRSTGEAFTMSFNGQGFVVVQASEEVPGSFVSGTGGGQQAGQAGSAAAGILGNFLGR